MAWAALPATSKVTAVLDDLYDEVRAAIVERQAEVGGAAPTNVAAGDAPVASVINEYYDKIEALIPNFRDPGSDYEAFSKGACLLAALGQSDWTYDPVVSKTTALHATIWNEMRLVLNELRWLQLALVSRSEEKKTPAGEGSDASWADAWSKTKTELSSATWSVTSDNRCGYFSTAHSPFGGFTYYYVIAPYRWTDIRFDVPNYGVAVSDAKFKLRAGTFESATGTIRVYDQANFAGATADANISGSFAWYVLDVATVTKNTTVHYSARTDPETPDPDSYRASAQDGGEKGFRATQSHLLVELDFAYK